MKAHSVDEYLSQLPEQTLETLETLRQTLRQAAPEAELAAGNHNLPELEAQLKPYRASVGTLQFQYSKPLPIGLVTQVVQLRMHQNKSKAADKQPKPKS